MRFFRIALVDNSKSKSKTMLINNPLHTRQRTDHCTTHRKTLIAIDDSSDLQEV
jgi:hypothetical protein